ncbi:hypothetical protein GCM10027299_33250 [Larkinella ripae]
MKPDWQDSRSSSYPETVVTIRKLIEQNEYEEAMAGLDELEDSLSKQEQRAVKSQLPFIESIWENCFDQAVTLAKAKMNLSRTIYLNLLR